MMFMCKISLRRAPGYIERGYVKTRAIIGEYHKIKMRKHLQ